MDPIENGKVFPSDQTTVFVRHDDVYGGAHKYGFLPSLGFSDGQANYVRMREDNFIVVQFVQKEEDGSMTAGVQSEQLILALIDRTTKLNNRFPSPQFPKMIEGLQMFLDACRERVEERMAAGVMGKLSNIPPKTDGTNDAIDLQGLWMQYLKLKNLDLPMECPAGVTFELILEALEKNQYIVCSEMDANKLSNPIWSLSDKLPESPLNPENVSGPSDPDIANAVMVLWQQYLPTVFYNAPAEPYPGITPDFIRQAIDEHMYISEQHKENEPSQLTLIPIPEHLIQYHELCAKYEALCNGKSQHPKDRPKDLPIGLLQQAVDEKRILIQENGVWTLAGQIIAHENTSETGAISPS